jgi:hypothetical protein
MAEGSSSLEERVGILERHLAAREGAQYPFVRFAWELFIFVVILGAIIVAHAIRDVSDKVKDVSDKVESLARRVESLERRGGR